METNRLRQFRVLVETKHLRNAAEILSISHAGLYKSLKHLESELNMPLFFSKGKRLEITEEGKRLYKKIPELLTAVESLSEKEVASYRPCTIGTFEVFSTHVVSFLLESTQWKETTIRLLELVPGHLETAVADGRIDLGITYIPIPTPEVEYYPVNILRMGIYSAPGVFPGVAAEDLPFAVPARPLQGTPTEVKGLDGWPDNLFPRKVRFEVDMMESALELARAGRSVSFLPEPVVRFHNKKHLPPFKLTEREPPKGFPDVTREIFVIRAKNRVEDSYEKRLASALRRL